MHLLDPPKHPGWLPAGESAEVALLAWGVSNVVLRVTPRDSAPFVVKQSRGQLRTRDPWFSRLERIWREADAMRELQPLLPEGRIPRVIREERDNYVFAMEAAPAEHVVWKQSLLEGHFQPAVARELGVCLSAIHARTTGHNERLTTFVDRQVFIELRVDPFYRRVAQAAPEIAPRIDRMIDEMFATPVCLVHGDFSPKNVLLTADRLVLVDFETVHLGDPAFDLGFFLSHLLLKTVLHRARFESAANLTVAFWSTYRTGLADLADHPVFAPDRLVPRMIPHLAGCMWARIDGTSKIDYLPDPAEQNAV
ncbi:MAG: aminoglycoside phosphotransferase family protein, partial [Planctomycetota bacterium]|nr:aminoglycoside phosphotransferase family protein [Planctomycetota bacterium]